MIKSCFFLMNPDRAMQSYGKMKLKMSSFRWYLLSEIAVRVLMVAGFCYLEGVEPFHQTIAKEQLWKYQNANLSTDKVNLMILMVICLLIPVSFMIAYYVFSNDMTDVIQGILGLVLSCLLNGVLIDVIKICVGRPRPDYYYRCFPDGKVTLDLECSGDHDSVIEGRKSFPSGHTGWTFAGLFFLSLYLAGKLQCFCYGGKTHSWRLIVIVTPVLAATVIGISRIQDNRHHWEDVTVGAVIGILSALLCYHHYYPSLFSDDCFLPYPISSSNGFSTSQSSANLNASALSMTNSRRSFSGGNSKLQLTEVTIQ